MQLSRRAGGLAALIMTALAAACGPTHAAATAGLDPLLGQKLYVDPHSAAAQNAADLRQSQPHEAAELDKIARQPQADWFGDWDPTSQVRATVAARTQLIHKAGALPVYVVYDIPERDCNGYSGGGAPSPAAYRTWIKNFTAGVGAGRAVVIVEPDALAMMDCLSAADQATRESLLRFAVKTLTTHAKTVVYLDAGHSGWIPAAEMASRLRAADVAQARGFSLNVSNFDPTSVEKAYGHDIADSIGGKHFVIDTSRNGRGSTGDWCNPPGRALGTRPTAKTGDAYVDAYLWIKRPGESDGTCNGGPTAGLWWTDYAVGLAQRASY